MEKLFAFHLHGREPACCTVRMSNSSQLINLHGPVEFGIPPNSTLLKATILHHSRLQFLFWDCFFKFVTTLIEVAIFEWNHA